MDMISYDSIVGLFKSPTDETQYNEYLHKLTQEGIFHMELLKVFAARCEVEAHFLAILLNHLQIAYYQPGNQWIFFPWYLSSIHPAYIDVDSYKTSTSNQLILISCIKGYIPCIFFNRLILGIYPHLEPNRSDVSRHIWNKHLCLEIDDIKLYLEQDKEEDTDRITLYVSSPLEVRPIRQVWSLLSNFMVVLEKIWYSFSGLVLDCYQKCPCCGSCKWAIRQNIYLTCRPGQKSMCKNERQNKWPSSMIYPLPNGNLIY
jgi:hypothetical protein